VNDLFEDQLRSDLHAAAGHTAYPSIDPATVIGEGRRVVRRRHRLQALGAAAAVAAIAVGGVLATDVGRTTTAPPAGGTATQPPVTSRALVTLAEDGGGRLLAELGPADREVRVLDVSGDTRPVVATLRVPQGDSPMVSAVVEGGRMLVGLMPRGGHLLQAGAEGRPTEGGWRHDERLLGRDLVVFGVRFDVPLPMDATPRIVWTDQRQVVWDGTRPMPSTAFESSGDLVGDPLVWLDPRRSTWGFSDSSVRGTLTERRLEPFALATLPSVAGEGQAEAVGHTHVAGLLPGTDLSNLEPLWARGVTPVSPLRARTLTTDGDGLTAFHALVRVESGIPGPLVQRLTWTDPDGQSRQQTFLDY
jgi:hypothetical protein